MTNQDLINQAVLDSLDDIKAVLKSISERQDKLEECMVEISDDYVKMVSRMQDLRDDITEIKNHHLQ